MALVKCPDCGREISPTAPTCIQCGRQMVATTVEQTSKPIKATQAGGCLAVPLGIFMIIGGATNDIKALSALGSLCVFGGMVAYLAASIAKWWKHE